MTRLTERDRDMVRWIADLYACQVGHAAERLGVGRPMARRRLDRCVVWSILERVVILHGRGAWWYATREGLRWASRDYAP